MRLGALFVLGTVSPAPGTDRHTVGVSVNVQLNEKIGFKETCL